LNQDLIAKRLRAKPSAKARRGSAKLSADKAAQPDGGAKTSEATIQRAAEFYTGLGKQAVRLPPWPPPRWLSIMLPMMPQTQARSPAQRGVDVRSADDAFGDEVIDLPRQRPRRRLPRPKRLPAPAKGRRAFRSLALATHDAQVT
jgi:hypothetical protein